MSRLLREAAGRYLQCCCRRPSMVVAYRRSASGFGKTAPAALRLLYLPRNDFCNTTASRVASPDLVRRMMEIARRLCMIPTAKTAFKAAHNHCRMMEKPLTGRLFFEQESKMPRKFRQELPEREILRNRAVRCRRLPDGVGDLAFAIKLHALSEEYEREANRKKSDVALVGLITRTTQRE